MQWVRAAAREVAGLFVDDAAYAAAILAWLALSWLIVAFVARTAGWAGPIIFAGLAAILLGSSIHRARRARRNE